MVRWTNETPSILETHHKNIIILGGFSLSIAGWWLWQVILSRMYPAEMDIYLVYDNFLLHFGRSLGWWAICLLELGTLVILDLVVQSIRRVYFPTDQDLMQRIERDAKSRKAMQDHSAGRLENGEGLEMDDVVPASAQPPLSAARPPHHLHPGAAPRRPPRPDVDPSARYSNGPDSPTYDRPVSVRDFPVSERPVVGRSGSDAWTGTASYYYDRVDPHRSPRQ